MSSASSSAAVPQHASLLYAAVAKAKTILASHANGTVNASQIATLILDRIDLSSDSKQTFVHQKYQIHYIHTAKVPGVTGGLTYLVIGTEALGRRIPFTFLFDVRHVFQETYESTEIASAGAHELQDFSNTLREKMDAVLNSSGEAGAGSGGDKAREVQREIDSVKDIMSQNIERVLERGERIDLLVDKSAHLGSTSLAFKKRSQAVKNQMWWQKTRTTALIALVVVFLLYLMIGIGCGLPFFGRLFLSIIISGFDDGV